MKTNLGLVIALLSMAVPAVGHSQYDTPAPDTVVPRVNLGDLPTAAQERVKKEAAGREIAKIERETWNGHAGYRVQFAEKGRNPDVYVADDGSLIRPEEKPPGAKTLFMGTTLKDTPATVQQVIQREVGSGEILKIDREGRGEERSYKVSVRDPQGSNYQLQVGLDGKILLDSRQTAGSAAK